MLDASDSVTHSPETQSIFHIVVIVIIKPSTLSNLVFASFGKQQCELLSFMLGV